MQRAHQQQRPVRDTRLSRQELQERLRETDAALQEALEKMKALHGLAFTDALTGVANRRSLEDRLIQELSRAQRRSDRAFSLLVLDLDGFKEINDTLGHAAGDQVLARVAHFLVAQLRTHDVVARTGGDEFTVLMPDTGADECARAVARLRQSFEGFDVRCSLGSSSWPGGGQTIGRLIHEADLAMYADKRSRRAPIDQGA
jgi:diguanylate cyclase (GGDEF)-like protein